MPAIVWGVRGHATGQAVAAHRTANCGKLKSAQSQTLPYGETELMKPADKATNRRTIDVQLNGQQEQLVERMTERDTLARPAEELIRLGFLEFAKRKRLTSQ
jgi:hypothetical protein